MVETTYETLFQSAPVPLIITDQKGTVKLANEQAGGLLDNESLPLVGLGFFEFIDQSIFKNYFTDRPVSSFQDFLNLYDIHANKETIEQGPPPSAHIKVASFKIGNEDFYIWTFDSTEIARKLKYDLNERVKEQLAILNVIELCFQNQNLHTSLQRSLSAIREGWRFPDLTEVRIALKSGEVFATDNFKATSWCMQTDIVSTKEHYGHLEVCYQRAVPAYGGETFLYEEERLIKVLGKIIGTIIEHWQGTKRMNEAVVNAQEEERYQLAMELHDNVQQILTAASLHAGLLQSLHSDVPSQEVTNNLKTYLSEAIQELRNLSQQLAPSVEPGIPLAEKINSLLKGMNVNGRLKAKIAIEPDIILNDKVQLGFYRIIQEQLTNIIKHAKTSEVGINIKSDMQNIILSINDEGVGFDVNSRKSGIGLENIRRRTEYMNGSLNIISAPGKGTRVTVQVPVASSYEGENWQ